MQFSPKLKTAAEEIKEILAKYDIAGAIVLHTPGFSEFVINITPSYSCAWIQGNMLRMRAKLSEYDSREEFAGTLANTSNMFKHLSETSSMVTEMMVSGSKTIDAHLNAEHGDSEFTSHETQNN